MLSVSVLLLATSALVGAAVLPQPGSDVDKPTTYKPNYFGRNVDDTVPVVSHLPVQQQPFQRQLVVGRNVPVQPVQPVQNVFLRQQPKNAEFTRVQHVQPKFVQPAQPAFNQVSVLSKSGVVDQGTVQPQQPVMVEPKHHAVGHDVFADTVVPTQFASARIVQQDLDISPDGSFVNAWDSDNGIKVQEQGTVKQVGKTNVAVQQGEISYVDNEGNTFSIKYVADETGFHVEGDHLPTPPPIPLAIQRGLQYNMEHPWVETTPEPEQYQPGQQAPQSGQPPFVYDN